MKDLCAGVSLFALSWAFSANAADMPLKAPAWTPPVYNWTGLYAGFNVGAAWGSYDPQTSTTPNTYLFSPLDVAAVNAAGAQRIDPLGFSGGEQIGYNQQFGRLSSVSKPISTTSI